MLLAWVIGTEGRTHLLHLAVGNKESEDCWVALFRHMVARALDADVATSGGRPG